MPSRPFIGATLVLAEQKQERTEELDDDYANKVEKSQRKTQPAKIAEFQLPGEMLSAAAQNYRQDGLPQTIFGLRVLGMLLFI